MNQTQSSLDHFGLLLLRIVKKVLMTSNPIDDLLPLVEKPSRYLGSEINIVKKDLQRVALRVALVFPDLYEIGTSHFGLQILYHISNDHPDIAAERVFDIGLILLLLIMVLSYVEIDPGLDMTFGDYHLNRDTLISISQGMIRLCVVIIAGIVLISYEKTRLWIQRAISLMPSVLFFLGSSGRTKA